MAKNTTPETSAQEHMISDSDTDRATEQLPGTRSLRSAVLANSGPDRDAVLHSIEGKLVTIVAVDIANHRGKFRDYPLSSVTLDDGRQFVVAGKGIADILGQVDLDTGPILAAFRREPSSFREGDFYWTVE